MISDTAASQHTDVVKVSDKLWTSFGICLFCSIFAGLTSTLMGGYLPSLMQNLAQDGESQANIGAYIQSLYIGGWAVGGLAWGFISDKIGRTKALALSTGSLGLFTTLVSFAPSWEWVVALRLLAGFAVGGILVITPTLLSEIWPARSRAVMIGIDSIGFPVGIFSTGLVLVVADAWRLAFLIGIAPVVIAIASRFLMAESQHWRETKRQPDNATATSADRANLVKGSIIFGSMLIGLWGMFSWIPSWIQSFPGGNGTQESGIAMMLLGAGGLTGGFSSGWICNLMGVRQAMMLCFAGCIFMSGLLFGVNHSFSYAIYAELALLSFFFGISQGLLSIYIPQLFPVRIRGTFTGICFNIGRFVTAGAIFAVGLMVEFFHGYGTALLAFSGIFVVGFLAILYSRDDKTEK